MNGRCRSRQSPTQMVNDGGDDMDDNEVPSTAAASPPALLIRGPNPVNPPNKASSRADLEERRHATCHFVPSPSFRIHSSSRRPCFRRLLFFFFGLCFLRCVSASHPFRVYAINANGLSDVMKQSAIVGGIISSKPHAWVINETKSTRSVASRVSIPGYDVFESVGLPAAGSKHGKWGVIVGVRRDIQSLRLDVHETLKGRVIALDLIIPTTSGYGFSHRFIGLYAPWDPGTSPDASSFWPLITDLCLSSPFSWSIAGDCNATLASCESSAINYSPNSATRQYSQFLRDTAGQDIWTSVLDRSVSALYTYRGPFGQSIIDRAAHSARGIAGADITIHPSFIGATDHRPILASIFLSPPRSFASRPPFTRPLLLVDTSTSDVRTQSRR